MHNESSLGSMYGYTRWSEFAMVVAWKYHIMLLTLLHSERPKLYTILAFLSAIGLKAPRVLYFMTEGIILSLKCSK